MQGFSTLFLGRRQASPDSTYGEEAYLRHFAEVFSNHYLFSGRFYQHNPALDTDQGKSVFASSQTFLQLAVEL